MNRRSRQALSIRRHTKLEPDQREVAHYLTTIISAKAQERALRDSLGSRVGSGQELKESWAQMSWSPISDNENHSFLHVHNARK